MHAAQYTTTPISWALTPRRYSTSEPLAQASQERPATLDLDQRSGSVGPHATTACLAASILGIETNTPFRDWAAMKDQDDTVPKLERASAKTLREYEALKVIQEYANSLREFMKAILRKRMN